MDKKKDDKGIQLRRDERNALDQGHVNDVMNDLTRKLITTERDVQKDMSFRNVRGSKRDIMMFVVVAQRNSVDGKVVLGDDPSNGFEPWSPRDPYKYKVYDYVECEMLSKEIPMSLHKCARFLNGCFQMTKTFLLRMNVVNQA